jgi:regulatory protein spx
MNMDIDQLPMKKLFPFIQKNPGLLKRPIIMDEKRLQVGYNEEEIRSFMPRSVRIFQLHETQKMIN